VGVSFGRPGFKPRPGKIPSVITVFVDTPHSTQFHTPAVKTVRETPSWIRVWSLIRNKKTIVLYERNYLVIEKSKAIAIYCINTG
jgi:hypothetical protein